MPSSLPLVRKSSLLRRRVALSSNMTVVRRSVTTRITRNYAVPSAPLMAPTPVIEQCSSSPALIQNGNMPACGWRKRIVASSYSFSSPANADISSAAEPASSTAAQTPTTQSEMDQTETDSELKLEVDMEELEKLASQVCTPLSLKDMYKYAVDINNQDQRLVNAAFLHKELPVRIAQRAHDLLTLPYGLSDVLPIRQVAHVYLRYLERFQEFPVPDTPEKETEFTDVLQSIVTDRSSIPMALARGVAEWGARHKEDLDQDRLQEMEDAFYRFFMARTGLRFLVEHHILSSPARSKTSAVRSNQTYFDKTEEITLGCIKTDCDPVKEVQKVVKAVTRQTEDHYGICPDIQIVDSIKNKMNFTYVPHHLQHMVGELLKNSCRATVRKYLEQQLKGEDSELEPIRVVIVQGAEDVTIKIADRGGGIPRSKMATIWRFSHSTANADEGSSEFGYDGLTGTRIKGFGLPLARIYARYLGGELTLKSMEGYGLDAYLYLPRLGEDCENLPKRVVASPGELDSNPQQVKPPSRFR